MDLTPASTLNDSVACESIEMTEYQPSIEPVALLRYLDPIGDFLNLEDVFIGRKGKALL